MTLMKTAAVKTPLVFCPSPAPVNIHLDVYFPLVTVMTYVLLPKLLVSHPSSCTASVFQESGGILCKSETNTTRLCFLNEHRFRPDHGELSYNSYDNHKIT